jgi:hypothetical protein
VALAATALLPFGAGGTAHAARPQHRPASLQQAYAAAAQRYHVPLSVLLGVSYLESRWDSHGGVPSVDAGYGPMHLTDAHTALTDYPQHPGTGDGGDDPRGDSARPVPAGRTANAAKSAAEPAPATADLPASLTTLDRAARLTGLSGTRLREDPAANITGGAALLAATQRSLGHAASTDPARWYGAVAAYPRSDDAGAARDFADDVFSVIRSGATRTTDTGDRVSLAPHPGLTPDTAQATAPAKVRAMGLNPSGGDHAKHPVKNASPIECPSTVTCQWVPAPYQQTGSGAGDYGNYDLADRPTDETVDYIVIHDTEATWDESLKLVQEPTYLGWHYTVRSSDGLIAQHIPTKDVGWHAGNWYVNAKSIGVEHEGFLVDPGTWYTEEMYRSSARLVRYLADRYRIPLDREHILGHDNVPGPTTSSIAGMHTDPGPYWDWGHYFDLLGAPIHATAGASGGLVTIDPDYAANQPVYTGCAAGGDGTDTCPAHGSTAIRLHTSPSEDAPLVSDVGLHPSGPSTTGVNDTGARASTGQQFVVAGRQGDWTAIWYLGQKAWFHNPAAQPTAVDGQGRVVTPKPGLGSVPVYGRAYPESSAYPSGVPVQALSPLPYTLPAGQAYVLGQVTPGEYYYSVTFDTASHTVVRGKQVYDEIQFGQRVAYVPASDVVVKDSSAAARR